MRKMLTILILLSAYFSICASTGKQPFINRTTVQFADPVIEDNTTFIDRILQQKEKRVSNKRGDINLVYNESLPDSVIAAISLAKNLWENKLYTKTPIFIEVKFAPLDTDIAINTDVSYMLFPEGCPTALASQNVRVPYGSTTSPDGTITLNSNLDWNCGYTSNATDYNVTTMTLRGICRCLGFGTSIRPANKLQYEFKTGGPSYFDRLLYNDVYRLEDLKELSFELNLFIKSGNVYAETPNASYKMYAPSKYEPNKTLCYLDSDDSIMSYSLSNKNICLSIDDNVVDILKAIGWDFKADGCEIICNDIKADGIGSSYTSHTFSLAQQSGISSYNWRFLLKDKSGDYTLVSQGYNSEFTVHTIDEPQNYDLNINGDLEGRIECDYIIDNKVYNAQAFNLSFELKPTILSIDNIYINRKDFGFSLNFDVNYRGADRVVVKLEEEFDTVLRTYRFNEPYIAHVSTGYMSSLCYSWVTVIITNKYGETSETLVFEPSYTETYNKINSPKESKSGMINSIIESEYGEIELISPNGEVVYKGSQESLTGMNIQPGIYIRKRLYSDGRIINDKLIIK